MFGIDRGRLFAVVTVIFALTEFGVWTLATWDISSSHTAHSLQAEKYSAEYAADADERIERDCAQPERTAFADCVREIEKTSREHQRGEADLGGNRDLTDWAFWAVIAAGSAAAFTGIGVIFVAATLNAQQKTNEIALKAVYFENRPWVSVHGLRISIVSIAVFADGDGGTTTEALVSGTYTLKNTGKAPALNLVDQHLSFNGAVAREKHIVARWFPNVRSIIDNVKMHSADRSLGLVLAPNAVRTVAFRDRIPLNRPDSDILDVSIAVAYRTGERDDIFETVQSFMVYRRDEADPGAAIAFDLASIAGEIAEDALTYRPGKPSVMT